MTGRRGKGREKKKKGPGSLAAWKPEGRAPGVPAPGRHAGSEWISGQKSGRRGGSN